MEMLKIFYAAVGAPSYPIASLIIIVILGASASGGLWLFIGKQYEKDQKEKQEKLIASDLTKTEVGSVSSANQTGVTAGVINGNVTINTTLPAQSHKAVARDKEAIYQAGIIVGKAFGARRSPTDATVFEFVEITHASQFNPAEFFQYQNLSLKVLTIETKIGLMSSRPEDGTILQKVTAKIITSPIKKHSSIESHSTTAYSNELPPSVQQISISTLDTHTCSHCGYGYQVNNFLRKNAAYIGATTTCPKCGSVEKVKTNIFGL
jgi:hypothetical protein